MRLSSDLGRVVATLSLLLCLAAAVSSCNSSSPAAGISQACALNSDCDSPLVCVFSRCHEACHVSSDCSASGERCVASGIGADGGHTNVCQLAVEATCAATSTCPGVEVCAADKQCRMACASVSDCPGGEQFCLPTGGLSLCYSSTSAADVSVLADAGLLAPDGGTLGGHDAGPESSATGPGNDAGDATIQPVGDDGSDAMTVGTPGDGSTDTAAAFSCGDATLFSDGGCDYCPVGACPHGTCVGGNHDYTCECYAGYSGTGTKSCAVLNSCLANNFCTPEYPCQPTASPGQACLGQFAAWPIPDWDAVAGSSTQMPSLATDPTAGTVTDQVTKLVWQLAAPPALSGCALPDAAVDAAATCTLADAKAYCSALRLAGQNDWRLPTKIELETLLDYTHAQPPYIMSAFLPAPDTSYWTASTLESNLGYEWFVDFSTTRATFWTTADVSAGSVRCVRGTGIGATTAPTHYTIHPGAIDAGAGDAGAGDAGAADAAVMDDTVTDNWTGLTWERNMASGMLSQPGGAAYCAALGSGFRLPTLKELLTLVDPILYSPAIDQNVFPNTAQTWFWSSSSVVPSNGTGFILDFGNGYFETYSSTGTFAVRCVH